MKKYISLLTVTLLASFLLIIQVIKKNTKDDEPDAALLIQAREVFERVKPTIEERVIQTKAVFSLEATFVGYLINECGIRDKVLDISLFLLLVASTFSRRYNEENGYGSCILR